MTEESIQPGSAFRSTYVDDGIFLFAFPCSIIEGDGLFRRFNVNAAFIEQDLYCFPVRAQHLERVGELDFVG